jgi:hypothetical protein
VKHQPVHHSSIGLPKHGKSPILCTGKHLCTRHQPGNEEEPRAGAKTSRLHAVVLDSKGTDGKVSVQILDGSLIK